MSFTRSLRGLSRELGAALHAAGVSRFATTAEGIGFGVAGALLAARLTVPHASMLEAQEPIRLMMTIASVLLPLALLLRAAALLIGSGDPRQSRVDDAAIALAALVAWAATLESLLGVRLLAAVPARAEILATIGALLIGLGVVSLVLVSHRLSSESQARRWSPMRARDVWTRELTRRVAPLLAGPALISAASGIELSLLSWLAAAGFALHLVGSVLTATRRPSFAI